MYKKKNENKNTVKNKSEEKVRTPHDFFIQAVLTDVKVAHNFFEIHLPAELKKIIDLTTLSHCTRSFITKRFKKLEADIIYRVNINNKPGYLYLLFEAQSTIDVLQPFRLLSYLVEIMRYHIEKLKYKELPLVIPLVLYSGTARYTGPRTLAELFKDTDHQTTINKVLTEPFQLIDIKRMSDEEIKNHHYSGLIEFALKYAEETEFLEHFKNYTKIIKTWVDLAGIPVLQDALSYFIQCIENSNLPELESILNTEFDDEVREAIMGTIAEKWEKQGIEKGMEKGIEKGIEKGKKQGIKEGRKETQEIIALNMIKAGARLDFVHKMTSLSMTKLKEMKAQQPRTKKKYTNDQDQ